MEKQAVGLVAVAFVVLSVGEARGGQWVNVKAQWCNNTCSEGHDDAACLCEYNKGQWPGVPYSWNNCRGVPCCAHGSVTCRVGEPGCSCMFADGSNPAQMRRYCFPDSPDIICRAPNQAGAYECSYNCNYQSECTISYPTSAANYVYINTPDGEQCTGENETGWWSWAAFRSFFFGTDTCTLNQQSPWDDYPLEAEICE